MISAIKWSCSYKSWNFMTEPGFVIKFEGEIIQAQQHTSINLIICISTHYGQGLGHYISILRHIIHWVNYSLTNDEKTHFLINAFQWFQHNMAQLYNASYISAAIIFSCTYLMAADYDALHCIIGPALFVYVYPRDNRLKLKWCTKWSPSRGG